MEKTDRDGDPVPTERPYEADDATDEAARAAEPHETAQHLLDLERDLGKARHANATMHLSDGSLAQAGVAAPAFRPELDEKGGHTGKLLVTDPENVPA